MGSDWGCGRLAMRRRKRNKVRVLNLIRNRRSMQNKLKQLKRLIPGGHEMDNAETLYQTTANYISLLECRVNTLRNISALCGKL